MPGKDYSVGGVELLWTVSRAMTCTINSTMSGMSFCIGGNVRLLFGVCQMLAGFDFVLRGTILHFARPCRNRAAGKHGLRPMRGPPPCGERESRSRPFSCMVFYDQRRRASQQAAGRPLMLEREHGAADLSAGRSLKIGTRILTSRPLTFRTARVPGRRPAAAVLGRPAEGRPRPKAARPQGR